MIDLAGFSFAAVIAVFIAATVVIGVAGTRLSEVADELADRTGMGEVVAGALFVGAATSLPGAITSITTATQGAPGLAVGNALGGLTAQTAFIAVADLFYRRANLEHAAASVTGLAQGVLLIVLLPMPLIAAAEPPVTVWGIHPVSIVIPVGYGFGLKLLTDIQDDPMWKPVKTAETRESLSDPEDGTTAPCLTNPSGPVSPALRRHDGVAGYFIGEASLALVDEDAACPSPRSGRSLHAVANSLPELVTAIAAVRIGAVSLAVGDVIGGNAFEVMFLSAADSLL